MAGRAVARAPKEIVARGYDAIALRYAEWAGQVDSPVIEWVRDLDARLDEGAEERRADQIVGADPSPADDEDDGGAVGFGVGSKHVERQRGTVTA